MPYYRSYPPNYMKRRHMSMTAEERKCGCTGEQQQDRALSALPLAMAYVPFQTWETPYELMEGLRQGTIFPSLDKPFLGSRGCLR